MHIQGVLGMPRRIYTYLPDRGWEIWNLITTLGVPVQAVAIAIFVVNVIVSLRRGERAGDDPWDAWTLEWATTSPPPALQLRGRSRDHEPPPALGPEASRRPRRAARVSR